MAFDYEESYSKLLSNNWGVDIIFGWGLVTNIVKLNLGQNESDEHLGNWYVPIIITVMMELQL